MDYTVLPMTATIGLGYGTASWAIDLIPGIGPKSGSGKEKADNVPS